MAAMHITDNIQEALSRLKTVGSLLWKIECRCIPNSAMSAEIYDCEVMTARLEKDGAALIKSSCPSRFIEAGQLINEAESVASRVDQLAKQVGF